MNFVSARRVRFRRLLAVAALGAVLGISAAGPLDRPAEAPATALAADGSNCAFCWD